MKLLIDTNIILDAFEKREPWCEAAESLLIAVAEEKAEGFITASTLTDLYYLLRKHLQDMDKAKQALLGLLAIVDVLEVTGTDCRNAFDLPIADYEDALLAYCARRHKMDCIVTRNTKHFVGSSVKAIQPDDWLKNL